MRTLILTLFIVINLCLPSGLYAIDDNGSDTDSAGILIPDNPIKNPNGQPESPYQLSIYYIISNNVITIYTPNSTMGTVIVTDCETSSVLNQVYSELSTGCHLSIPNNRKIKVSVIVNELTYSSVF